RLEPDVPRQVDGVRAGLHDVAEDHVVDVLRLDPRGSDGRLGGVHAQVGGGNVLERASVRAERRALGRKEDNLSGDGFHGRRITKMITIRILAEEHLSSLADLLLDAVASGASVNFMAGFTQEEAAAFWRSKADRLTLG